MSFPVDVENDGLASNAAYDLYAGGRSSSPSSSSSTRGLVDRVNSDIDVLITRNGSSSSSSTSTNTVLLATKEPSRQTTRFLGIDHPPNAIFSVVILFVVNLLNYIDRYIPSATKTSIQSDFDLNDAETAFPLTAFMIVYMLASPIFAHLSDLGWSRPRLMSSGVILWSILTALCALCPNYASFLTVRALTGIGESSYSVIAPSIISDFYASHDRSRVMALFYLGIPVGSAIGFGLGAGLSQLFGWRVAFAAVGLPGVILGVLMLRMVDPERGGLDDPEERRVRVAQRHQHPLRVALSVLTNRYFLGVSVGLTLQTFGIGGMADWFPTYLQHVQHMSEAYAGTVVGGVVVVGGIIGTIGGGWLADHTASHVRNSYLAMCGWSTLLAAGVAALIIAVASSDAVVIVLLLVTQTLIWMSVGPSNAIVANVVTASHRARAFSVLIMMQHALGDAISPSIIGAVSDASSLHAAAYIVPISWIAASAAWLFASRTLPPHQHGELAAELLRQEALMEGAVVVVDEELGATSQGKRKRSTPGADDDGDAAAAPRMSVASPTLVL